MIIRPKNTVLIGSKITKESNIKIQTSSYLVFTDQKNGSEIRVPQVGCNDITRIGEAKYNLEIKGRLFE